MRGGGCVAESISKNKQTNKQTHSIKKSLVKLNLHFLHNFMTESYKTDIIHNKLQNVYGKSAI